MRFIIYIFLVVIISAQVEFSQGGRIHISSYQKAVLNNETPVEYVPVQSYLEDNSVELKWDSSEPVGYMIGLNQNDTVCVTFDSIPGGTLDSVKVALARAGTIIGGVWELQKSGKTPLGTLLTDPFEVVMPTTTDYPYPVPYTNWTTIDLRSFNVSTDRPFAVGFIVGNTENDPGFMVATHVGFYSYHSFTYFTPPGRSSSWYYVKPSIDSVYIYLVRAYVSSQFATAVDNPHTIKEYYLSQNYPNPFNPETLIKYSIAEASNVRIKIFNLLGETVSQLVNSVQNAGEHTVRFNAAGKNLSSGVYFYSLEVTSKNGTRNFTSAKKLVYMK